MSEPFSPKDVARWAGGRLLQGPRDLELIGASIDTRTIEPGQLFIAISGPNHDAHGFLSQAVLSGAAGLVIEEGRELPPDLPSDLPVVAVADTTTALGAIASGHRARFDGPVIAITGSSGKTTTKEMVAAILEVDGPCLKTQGNFNNQYGLPLTLLRRRAEDLCAVVEIGTNHHGEIAVLAAIAKPDVGLITNIGTAHIEFLGSRAGIAQEKGALFEALGANGVAVVNLDDPLLVEQSRRAAGRILGFGFGEEAEVRAERVAFIDGNSFEFHLRTPVGEAAIHVAGLGDTTVINALAAAAACLAAGVAIESVRKGLAEYRSVAGRMARIAVADDVTLIDDTYNANPQSMQAALESLARLCTDKRGIAVVGDMGELGDMGEAAHRDTGRRAAELGLDFLFALGAHAKAVIAAAVEAGMDASRAHAFESHEELIRELRTTLAPSDWILVKGSRAMKMERVVQALSPEETR